MQSFNVGIHDGHAGVFTTLDVSVSPLERWPGFVTVWRGDALHVPAAQPGGPAVGARVLACDGSAIKDLITRNVFAFGGRIDEAGHWWVRARRVFVDDGNPFIRLPKRCEFDAGPGSRPFNLTLAWQASNEQSRQWRKDGYNGDALAVGLTEPRPGVFWVAMPSFQPDEAERAAYLALNKRVSEQRQRFLDAEAVVIDLRHNLAADLPTDPPAFTKPVYVIVRGQCASACLDALDVFTRFPNTRLIGAPSSADSTYMEVRTQALASGLAEVIIPQQGLRQTSACQRADLFAGHLHERAGLVDGQFPEISGRRSLLQTTLEWVGGSGYSVKFVCKYYKSLS